MSNSEDCQEPVYGVVGICGVVGNLVSRMLVDKKFEVMGTDSSPADKCKYLYTLKHYNFPKFLEENPDSFFSQADIIIPPPSLGVDSDLFKKISGYNVDILTVDDCLTRFKPEKPVVCITGTNGKTTTTTMLKHICRTLKLEPTEHGFTKLQGNIDYIPPLQARLKGDVAVLETGTFGNTGDLEIMMKRCEPECGVITNINPDHLDETHDFMDYAKIKGEFVDYMKEKKLIINSDDPTVLGLVKNMDVTTFGINTDTDDVGYKECWCGKTIKINETITGSGYYQCECGIKRPEPDYLAFEIEESEGRFKLKTPESVVDVNMKLIGLHNVYNVTGAIVAAREYFNLPMDKILMAVETFEGVPGRIEHLFTYEGMEVVLDYGHNPAGIETVLRELKKVYESVTVVLTVSSESGEQGDLEIFDKVLKFADFIVPASHASRMVAETRTEFIESGKIVMTNESKVEFDKTGTLGASSDQVIDGIKTGFKCKSSALICLGEAAFKYKKSILELK